MDLTVREAKFAALVQLVMNNQVCNRVNGSAPEIATTITLRTHPRHQGHQCLSVITIFISFRLLVSM